MATRGMATDATPAAALGAASDAARAAARRRDLLALAVAALGLRPMLVGIGPLVPAIRDDLGLNHGEAGLLSTIPLLGMGVFAVVMPRLVRRFGARWTITGSLAVMAVFGAARALAPDALAVVLLTVPVGLGIGIAGAAMPAFVKDRFPGGVAFATAVYTTAIQVGSAVSVAVAAPLVLWLGGWRLALVTFGAALALLVVGWHVLTSTVRAALLAPRAPRRAPEAPLAAGEPGIPAGGSGRAAVADAARTGHRAWLDPVAWWIAVTFSLSSLPFYGLIAWLPAAYVERGWSDVEAGLLTAVTAFAGLPATMAVGWLADRWGSRRLYLGAATILFVLGIVGLIVAPGLAWVCGPAAGAALGVTFMLTMILPLDVSHDPARTSAMTSVMLGVGYVLAALTPTALGAVRDATGSFADAFWFLVAAGCGLLLVSLPLSPARLARARGEA